MHQRAQAFAPGTRMGRYEIIGRLATGGMAEIYLASVVGIEGFRKLVVIKRILPEHAAHEHFVSMFLDEARLAANLQHPNIAQVYDIGNAAGSYFFAMEYVHGESVQKILAAARYSRRDIPLDQAVSIVIGVASGLHHAHEAVGQDGAPLGIVHRDVSPSNILVTYDGGVKLVDFGVAKAVTREARTQNGTLKGKIAYMSPEQIRGDPLDRRADVFSLGIVLYELTTGSRPFTGESEFALLNAIVNQEAPPPSAFSSAYPPTLERIVMRALRRNPAERYYSMQEMQLDLESFVREQRLLNSSVALATFVESLFGRKRDLWNGVEVPSDYVSISVVVDAGASFGSPRSERRGWRAFLKRKAVIAAAAIVVAVALATAALGLSGSDRPAAASPPERVAAAPPTAAAVVPERAQVEPPAAMPVAKAPVKATPAPRKAKATVKSPVARKVSRPSPRPLRKAPQPARPARPTRVSGGHF